MSISANLVGLSTHGPIRKYHNEPGPVLHQDTATKRRVDREVDLRRTGVRVGRVHAARLEETDSYKSADQTTLRGRGLLKKQRTHRNTLANDGGEGVRDRLNGVAAQARRDADVGRRVDEIEDEVIVGEEREAVSLSGRETQLGNELCDGRGGGRTLLSEGESSEGKESSDSSEGEHDERVRDRGCEIENKNGLKKKRKRKKKKKRRKDTDAGGSEEGGEDYRHGTSLLKYVCRLIGPEA
jgi:hypothetical protein